MDLSEHVKFGIESLELRLKAGLSAFAVPEPKTLDQWAREHFYLSAESSYVEQKWVPWWFQRAIMACISNDDIREINWRKSARVGYTKIILAAIGYFAQHKRRNQILWQPTDDDRDEFVKTELEPMLRDVAIMQTVFPAYLARHKDNTLQAKKFLGSIAHMKGGKAAKNYRRVSADTAYLDEYDAFDANIEKEGSPGKLAGKRVEGATFQKIVKGTTPKLKGFSNIEKDEKEADLFLTPHIPCPECGGYHDLRFGDKDDPHGFKWTDNDPETVRHLCPHCGALITQAQYLAIDGETCRYQSEDGTTLDHEGTFRDAAGQTIQPPAHIAFHTWSAYSPNVSWVSIVKDFLAAKREAGEGKKENLQAFVNTTLGEYWAEDYEQADDNELRARAEPFPLERVPMGCVLLLAGIDTQPNRLECNVWGYGRGCETWTIADRVFFGNPDQDEVWAELEEFLFETEFEHASGTKLKIAQSAIDTGGHNTQSVYRWVEKNQRRNVFAIKGRSGKEKAIRDGSVKIEYDHRGRLRKRGLMLWHVGTNLAKDTIYNRLQIIKPGPGYIHFSDELSENWFKQYTAEGRVSRRNQRGATETVWVCPSGRRNEKWDCAAYTVWLEEGIKVSNGRYGLAKAPAKFWDDLEAKVQPKVLDLFAQPTQPQQPAGNAPAPQESRDQPRRPVVHRPPAPIIGW